MAFYDLEKDERAALSAVIKNNIGGALFSSATEGITVYFSNDDTYIRKAGYLAIGRIYFEQQHLQPQIINLLNLLLQKEDFKIRQTAINAAGEIGKKDFDIVQQFFDKGLFDEHHSPRNAVIGSIKKMGEVNPMPVLAWAKKYLHH